MAKRILFLLALIWLATASRCERDNFIPYVPVNFEINLNLPAYQALNAPTGWITVSGGSRGIVIYRVNQDEFKAYDRHSTYDIEAACQIAVNEDNILVTDPCSGSQWLLLDGSVAEGPADLPLHQYNVIWNEPVLRVTN